MNNLKALFNHLSLGYISIAIIISTLLGMAGHDLITQLLQQPQNASTQSLGKNFSTILFIHLIEAFSTMVLYALINRYWGLKSLLVKTFIFALLLAVINENFLRRFLMDIIADHRNIGYEFLLVAVPAYISYILVAGTVVTFFSFQKKWLWKYVIAFVLVVFEYQYIESMIHAVLMSFFHLSPGGHFTQGPYDLSILISIYSTYLIPVTGMFITYLWIRQSFPKQASIRGLLFFILLVGVHGQLHGIFQIATSQGHILYRILYYGSFWWELLIVAFTIVFFVENSQAVKKFFHDLYWI